jgi:hypothetical protein
MKLVTVPQQAGTKPKTGCDGWRRVASNIAKLATLLSKEA